jgi:2-phospho-L-lactate guanylyltransferase
VDRPVRVIIPFKLRGAKSRLSAALSPEERELLALAMLRDVLDAASGLRVTVLSRPGLVERIGAEVVESGLDLNEALNKMIEDWAGRGWPSDVLIAMADMALLRGEDLRGMIETEGDLVLSPGRGGGTNMILIRSPEFRTCYKGLSFPRHLDLARKLGLEVVIYYSYRAGFDIDEPSDLAEVLIHGHGETRRLLGSLGFVLSENGRDACVRKSRSLDLTLSHSRLNQ